MTTAKILSLLLQAIPAQFDTNQSNGVFICQKFTTLLLSCVIQKNMSTFKTTSVNTESLSIFFERFQMSGMIVVFYECLILCLIRVAGLDVAWPEDTACEDDWEDFHASYCVCSHPFYICMCLYLWVFACACDRVHACYPGS